MRHVRDASVFRCAIAPEPVRPQPEVVSNSRRPDCNSAPDCHVVAAIRHSDSLLCKCVASYDLGFFGIAARPLAYDALTC